MRGYSGIDLASSAYLHFVRNSEIDPTTLEIFESAHHKGVVIIYLDYLALVGNGRSAFQVLAECLNLDHQPYAEDELLPFFDDLISLAYKMLGLVIVIDNGNEFLEKEPAGFFDLIEAFMVQMNHWFKLKKPCHLCFQMEQNDTIREILQNEGKGLPSK